MAISPRRPRVLVADDSTVAREGIATMIRRNPRYVLCGLASDERTLNELLEKHKPDLLLLEPFLGKRDGIFLLKQLATRFPETRILAISKQPEEVYAERALRAGASFRPATLENQLSGEKQGKIR
jgi:DNA-binding NarL/FixJ family response regulator